MKDELNNANEVCEFCSKPTPNVEKIEVGNQRVYFRVCKPCWEMKRESLTVHYTMLVEHHDRLELR